MSSHPSPNPTPQRIKRWWQTILELPADEQFKFDDVDLTKGEIAALCEHGLVTVVNQDDQLGYSKETNTYTVPDDVREQAEAEADAHHLLDCGHAAFRTIEPGRYTCRSDSCDAEYSRDELETVLGSDHDE